MINKIVVIYIEGFEQPMPKQEKHFFSVEQSKRLWNMYFLEAGYRNFIIQVFPKLFSQPSNIDKFVGIIRSKIKAFYKEVDDDNQIHVLVTGDHDEIGDLTTLDKTERIASALKDEFNATVILERKRNFKLESIMAEMVKAKINKKTLREKTGKEYPNVKELLHAFGVTPETMVKNLLNSKHPLFIEINKLGKIKKC